MKTEKNSQKLEKVDVIQIAKRYKKLGFVPMGIKTTEAFPPDASDIAKGKKFKKKFSSITDWPNQSADDLFDTIKENSAGLAVRTGENNNGDVIWCLDFDDYKRNDEFRGQMLAVYGESPFEISTSGGLHYFFKAINKDFFKSFSVFRDFEFEVGLSKFEKHKVEVFGNKHMTYVYPTTVEYEGKQYRNTLCTKLKNYEIPTCEALETYLISLKDDPIVVERGNAPPVIALEDEDEQLAEHEHNPEYWAFLYNQLNLEKIKEKYGGEKSWKDLVLIAKYLWKSSEEGLDFICKFCEKFYGFEYNEDEIHGFWHRANRYKQRPGFPTLKRLVIASGGVMDDPNDKPARDQPNWIIETKEWSQTTMGQQMKALPDSVQAFKLYDDIVKQFSKHMILYTKGIQSYIISLKTYECTIRNLTTRNNVWDQTELDHATKQKVNITKTIKYSVGDEKPIKHTFDLLNDWQFNPKYSKYLIEVKHLTIKPGKPLIVKNESTGEYTMNTWLRPTMTREQVIKHIEETYTSEQIAEFKKLYKNHLHKVLANDHKKDTEYLNMVFLGIVNKPDFRPQIAVILKGTPGCGKSEFIHLTFDSYFGDAFSMLSNPDLCKLGVDKQLIGRTVALFEEFQAKDEDNYSKLKTFVDGGKYGFRVMHKDTVSLDNNCFLFISSNHDIPIKRKTADDRRFMEFQCSERYVGDEEYFKTLYRTLPAVFGVYYFMKMWDEGGEEIQAKLESFRFQHYKTQANIEQIDYNLSPVQRADVYMYKYVMYKCNRTISRDDLYMKYIDYCMKNDVDKMYQMTKTSFLTKTTAILRTTGERKVRVEQYKRYIADEAEEEDVSADEPTNDKAWAVVVKLHKKRQFKENFKRKFGKSPEDIDI